MFCLDKKKSLIPNIMTIININIISCQFCISFHVLLHEILLGIQYNYCIYKLQTTYWHWVCPAEHNSKWQEILSSTVIPKDAAPKCVTMPVSNALVSLNTLTPSLLTCTHARARTHTQNSLLARHSMQPRW